MMKLAILTAVVALASAAPQKDAKVLHKEQQINEDGSYRFSYDIDNGISVSEQGVGGVSAQGEFSFPNTDGGAPIELRWHADENGFRAEGAHLPTPPPVPDYILRALEYIQAHAHKDGPSLKQRRF